MAVGTPKVGALAGTGVSTSTLSVPYPAGVQVGDLLLVVIPARAAVEDPGFASPGWTAVTAQTPASTCRQTILWRIATTANTQGGSLAVTGPAVLASGKMLAVSGVDQADPFGPPSTFNGTGTTAPSMPGQTPPREGSLLVWAVSGFNGAGVTWQPTKNGVVNSAGVTEWLDTWQEISSGDGRSGAAYFETWPGTGATGARGGQQTTGASSAGVYLVLNPALGGGTEDPPPPAGDGALPVWPSVRSSAGTSHSSSSGTVTAETVRRPPLVEAGDLLVLYAVMDAGVVGDLVPPAGFTELGKRGTGANNPVGGVAYKIAGGSEPSTYTYQRLSASADGASVMVAVKDWSGDPAGLRFAVQETTRAAAATPAVTPATGRGLVLHSAHHDASAATTWSWVAPGGGLLSGVSHNAAGWSSVAVSDSLHTDSGSVGSRSWSGSTISSTVTQMVTSSLTIPAGSVTVPVSGPVMSGGSGGPLTDQTFLQFAQGGITHTYHRYAAGLDWTKPVGLLIYTDGSAEFGLNNPTYSYLLGGADGLVAVAKKHNMILLTPMAPGGGCSDGDGVCWYGTSTVSGITPEQKLAWSKALIEQVLGQYDIDRSRIAFGGYSSGAQWTTQYWGPGHAHEQVVDGVAVPISYGGAPKVANNNTAGFKAAVPFVWNVGDLDDAWSGGTSVHRVHGGVTYYDANGYETHLAVIAGLGHSRYVSGRGEFGQIVDRAITAHVRPATFTVAGPQEHAGTLTLTGTGTVELFGTGGEPPPADRPYFQAADWLWDPIPASPVLHAKNTTWAGYLAAGQHPANINEYANAIVYLTEIDGSTPRYSVSASMAPGWGPNPFAGYQIPVPVAARSRVVPFDGENDAWLIVADPQTNKVFHLWQAKWTGTTWTASWGGVSDIAGDARDDITGSGLSNFGGTIRLAALQAAAAAGTGLGHALQFSSDATAGSLQSQFVYPATKTDGHLWTQVVADPIWEGTRIQLDPSVNVDGISGITAAEKVIARTLQTHGAYLIDNGGARAAFMFERQANGSITGYSNLGLGWDYYNLDKIPWGSMRVLRHWHGGETLEQEQPAVTNLYTDPFFQDPATNTARSTGGWTVTAGQAVWPGPADASFYLNATNAWGPAGLPPAGEYEIKVTFSGAVPSASFWATPSAAVTGWSTTGQVLTGTLVVPPEGLTALALWVGGPATVTHVSIAEPGAIEPPPGPDLSRDGLQETIFQFVSTVENSTFNWWEQYGYVEALSYDYQMRGYTCGIIGFTTGTFDATMVVEEYQTLSPGNQFAADFLPTMQQIDAYADDATRGQYSIGLLEPLGFPARWLAEANEPLFRQAQRNIRDEKYWDPAYAQAVTDGVSELGLLVYYDTIVNHGSWAGPPPGYGTFQWCRAEALKTTTLPKDGGDEAAYLNALLDARWLILTEWGDANVNGRVPALRGFVNAGRFDLAIPPTLAWSMYGTPFSLTSQPVAGDYVAPQSGTLTLAGSGSVTLTGTPAQSGTLTLAGAGSLELSGVAAQPGILTLTGSGGLELAGAPAQSGTLTLTGSGGLELSGQSPRSGTLTLTGGGSLVLTGQGPVIVEPVTPPEVFGLRLAGYTLGGGYRGEAPAPLSVEWVTREGELPTLKVTYSELAPAARILEGAAEVSVLLPGDGRTWIEPPDGRMVVAADSWERLKDGTRTHSYDFVGLASEFAHHQLTEGAGTERTFTDVTAGALIAAWVSEIQAAGGLPWLQLGFDATTDSRGEPWPYYLDNGAIDGTQVHTDTVPLRTKDLLTQLQSMPRVQWWMQGRTLMLAPWRPGTAGGVHLPDVWMTESPERIGHSSTATHIRVVGDEGKHWLFAVPGASLAYGRRVLVVQAQGVTDENSAALHAETLFPQVRDAAESFTRQWRLTAATPWLPGRDVRLGDWVTADTVAGRRQPARVAGMSITAGKDLTAFVTLGTVQDGLLLRMAKSARSASGGVGVRNGTPKPVPQPPVERPWPEAPTGLSVVLSGWPVPGGHGGVIGASWDAVAVDTGGNAVDPDQYTVRARKAGGSWLDPLFRTNDLMGQQEPAGGLVPGDTWEVQVAAMLDDRTGIWSAPWSGQVQADSQAPPVPSGLDARSEPAQLVIEWDGKDADGHDMPLDVKHIEVALDGVVKTWTMGITSRSLRIDAGPGMDLAIGNTYTIRARAVDYAGNASGWTPAVFVAIRPETAWPASPAGLVVNVETVTSPEGAYRGVFSATWAAVSTDVDGLPVTIVRYAVRVRRTVGEFPVSWFDLGSSSRLTLTGSHDLIRVGDVWEVAVAAVSNGGHTGPFSAAVPVTVPPDSTPPQVPSRPGVVSSLGLLSVSWNGLSQSEGGMDADLDHLDILITGQGTVGRLDPVVRVEHLTGLAIGTAYEVRLVAVDRAGNESDPSQSASVTVVSAITGLSERVDQVEQDFAAADAALSGRIDSIVVSSSGGVVTWMGSTTPVAPEQRPHMAGDIWWDTATGTQKRFDGTAWAAFQVGNAGIASVDAAKITTGYLDSARLKTDAAWVTNQLLIGNSDEVVIDPTWQNAALNESRARSGWTVEPGAVTRTTGSADDFWLGATSSWPAASSHLPLRAGVRYRIEASVRLDVAGDAGIVYRTTGGAYAHVVGPQSLTAGIEYVLTGEYVWGGSELAVSAPPGSFGVRLTAAGTVRRVSVRPMLAKVLIQDGLISTPKLAAGAVDADKIKAGAVTALKLSTDALDFKTATGIVLTAPNIQSTSTANRGLKLSATNKRVYDTAGNITLEEDYGTGSIMMSGTFRTRGAYPHLDIGRNLWADFAGLQWTIGPGWQSKPEIITNASKWGIDTPGGIYLRGGNRDNLTMRPEVALRSGRPVNGSDQYWPEVDILLARSPSVYGRIRLQDIGENKTSIAASADFIRFDTKTGQSLVLNEVGSPGDIRVISPAGIGLEVGNSWLMFKGLGSSTGGSDVVMEGGNRIAVRSSLSVDKLDQQPIPVLYELLEVPAKTWVDRPRREQDPTWETRYAGVVYEDVAGVSAAHGGSLDHLLIKSNSEPAGIAYNAVGPTLIPIVADLARRVTELEEAMA